MRSWPLWAHFLQRTWDKIWTGSCRYEPSQARKYKATPISRLYCSGPCKLWLKINQSPPTLTYRRFSVSCQSLVWTLDKWPRRSGKGGFWFPLMPYGHFVAWAMWLPVAGHAPPSPVQYRWSAPHPPPSYCSEGTEPWLWRKEMSSKSKAKVQGKFIDSSSFQVWRQTQETSDRTRNVIWWKAGATCICGRLGHLGGLPYEPQRCTEIYTLPDWKSAPGPYCASSQTHPLPNSFQARVSNPKICGGADKPLGMGEVYVCSDAAQRGPGGVAPRPAPGPPGPSRNW